MEDYRTVEPEDLPLAEGARVLASNKDGLVAIEKSAGQLSHPNCPEDIERAILRASYDYNEEYYFWKDTESRECRAWLVNRLDSPTSGVLFLALNASINEAVKQVFATRKVKKTYFAIVRHVPKPNAGSWSDTLSKDLRNGKRVIKNGKRVAAKAYYQVVNKPTGGFPVSLLKLQPVTGRTHQLRIQCQKHGHPIVGDRNYGHFGFNKEVRLATGDKRMMLHSAETAVNYTFKGKVGGLKAFSPMPQSFRKLMQYRPGMEPDEEAGSVGGDLLAGRRFKGGSVR